MTMHPSIPARAAAARYIEIAVALRDAGLPPNAPLEQLIAERYATGVEDGMMIAHDDLSVAAPSPSPEVEQRASRRVSVRARRLAASLRRWVR